MSDPKVVKVWYDYDVSEKGWVLDLGEGRYEVNNLPYLTDKVCFQDIVTLKPVSSSSGLLGFFRWFFGKPPASEGLLTVDRVLERKNPLGCLLEYNPPSQSKYAELRDIVLKLGGYAEGMVPGVMVVSAPAGFPVDQLREHGTVGEVSICELP